MREASPRAKNKNYMNKDKIKELGDAWKALDDKYDNSILEIIDSSEPTLSEEKLEELKKMQDELFDLEVELFKALQAE